VESILQLTILALKLDGLEHGQFRLDGLDAIILHLHHAFVLLLEALDALLEVVFELLDRGTLLINGSLDSSSTLGRPIIEEGFLLVVAEVEVGEAARRAEVLGSKGLERLEVAATFVIITFRVAGEVLDGGVTLDTVLAAEVLVDSAVHIADENVLGISKLVTELVPSRFHRLAVASPRSQELDEGTLARSQLIKIVRVELNSPGGSHGCGDGADNSSNSGKL